MPEGFPGRARKMALPGGSAKTDSELIVGRQQQCGFRPVRRRDDPELTLFWQQVRGHESTSEKGGLLIALPILLPEVALVAVSVAVQAVHKLATNLTTIRLAKDPLELVLGWQTGQRNFLTAFREEINLASLRRLFEE